MQQCVDGPGCWPCRKCDPCKQAQAELDKARQEAQPAELAKLEAAFQSR